MRGDLSPIVARFGTWAVTTYGLECTEQYYPIDKTQLLDADWIPHMGRKRWLQWADFENALEAAILYHHPRRVPKKDRAKPVDVKQRFRVMRRDGFACQLCGAESGDGVKLHVDHRIPRSKGGTSEDENLWTLCQECNLGKSDL